MNKNTFIKVLSVLVIFAVIISTVGCSIGNQKSPIKDGEVGAVDTSDLVTENGTAIHEFTKVNEETGETEKVTQVIDVDMADTPIMNNENLLDSTSKDEFINHDGKEDYGMSDDVIQDVISKPENWKTFYIYKYIENKTDKTMVTGSVVADNNGEGSIYVRSKLDADYGIGAGAVSNIAIHATVDMSKYETDEDLAKALEKLDIKIQYTLTDDPYGEIDDWNSVTTDVIPIN